MPVDYLYVFYVVVAREYRFVNCLFATIVDVMLYWKKYKIRCWGFWGQDYPDGFGRQFGLRSVILVVLLIDFRSNKYLYEFDGS